MNGRLGRVGGALEALGSGLARSRGMRARRGRGGGRHLVGVCVLLGVLVGGDFSTCRKDNGAQCHNGYSLMYYI